MQDRYFEEFEENNGNPVLIDLFSITAIKKAPLAVSKQYEINTYIYVSHNCYGVKESYETVKKAVEQAWMQKKNREHYEHGMMSQPWGQGPSYN